MSARPILIMAGGTGGHVYPALALARLLRRRSQPVVWLGTRKGLEARVVPAEQIPIEWLTVGGLRGKGWLTLLAAPFRLARALWQALQVMRRHRPAAVVGLGGFVTGPGGVAAWLTRRPLIIHEQNAVAGFTNRCLSHLADEVLEAFPNSFGNAVPTRTIGNPVREDIAAAATPQVRFAGRHGAINVLVFGGSQGAVRLNTVVPLALAELGSGQHLNVRHQAGARWQDAAVQNYARSGVRAEVTAFIEDMAEAYGWADLVICRSGALTVCELAAVGVASILVPFPRGGRRSPDRECRIPGRSRGRTADRGTATLTPQAVVRSAAETMHRSRASCWRWRSRPGIWPSRAPPRIWPRPACATRRCRHDPGPR